MALTYAPAANSSFKCPDFDLPAVDGKRYRRADFNGNLVVLFLCGHCPYVQAIEDRIVRLAHEYMGKGIHFVAICANDARENPEDTPAALLKRSVEKNYGFPYLIDETQAVAKAFGAVCTPDIFAFDARGELAYRGRLDDSWKNETRVQRQELREALEKILQGQKITEQNPSMGCSIKWKSN